jgi:hypothetical protein
MPAIACCSGGGDESATQRLDWNKTGRHAGSHTLKPACWICAQAAVGVPARGPGCERRCPASHSPQPGSWRDSRGTPHGHRRRQGRVLRPRRRQRGRRSARAVACHLPQAPAAPGTAVQRAAQLCSCCSHRPAGAGFRIPGYWENPLQPASHYQAHPHDHPLHPGPGAQHRWLAVAKGDAWPACLLPACC